MPADFGQEVAYPASSDFDFGIRQICVPAEEPD
jgi:hypothetical protein